MNICLGTQGRKSACKEETFVTDLDEYTGTWEGCIADSLVELIKDTVLYNLLADSDNTKAGDLVDLLTEEYYKLLANADKYSKEDFNHLAFFVQNYKEACYKYPNAAVNIYKD